MPELPDAASVAPGMDPSAVRELYDRVYDELRRLARSQLRRAGRSTLQTTEVIHEAYVRLQGQMEIGINDRNHFFALSARAMRQVLIDHFRRRQAQKRGGGEAVLPLDEGLVPTGERGAVLLELDAALERLAETSPRLAQIVELKFFGGMTQDEIGEMLGISPRTVRNDWRKAKAWLALELERS